VLSNDGTRRRPPGHGNCHTREAGLSDLEPKNAPEASEEIELSVVMPCLDEADTIAVCVEKALKAIGEGGFRAEVLVADNGSKDGSQAIATRLGARVVPVSARGYGNALMGGIAAARGRFVIMGDADDSYDFLELGKFVTKLREGHDLVQGCRLPSGGGRVLPGAMPPSHRWIGNPMFSLLARVWFGAPIHDVYCGFRGFTRAHYERLDQRCTGMEFATEMIIKSTFAKAKIAEVPITLHPDGRKAHAPHLRTVRDGWRTLRFFLMYCPRWLFLLPGLLLILLGAVAYALALPGVTLFGATFDAHTLLFGSVFVLCGYQAVLFSVFTKVFSVRAGLLPEDPEFVSLFTRITLETGLVAGLVALLTGAGLLVAAVLKWAAVSFGHLDYAETMRWVIPGATLTALGFQTLLSSFFVSILGMGRK
jgi:glycosyltransferase involved in cell wall biosynthesis